MVLGLDRDVGCLEIPVKSSWATVTVGAPPARGNGPHRAVGATGRSCLLLPGTMPSLERSRLRRTQFGARLPDGSVPGATLPQTSDPLRLRQVSARPGEIAGASEHPSRLDAKCHRARFTDPGRIRMEVLRLPGNRQCINGRSAAQSCTPSTRTIRCDGIPDDSARGRARSSSSRARSRLPRATGDEMPPSASRTWIRPVFSS